MALEALRDCLRKKTASLDDLHRAARTRRMANVMRPYLEANTHMTQGKPKDKRHRFKDA
jgi:hypothetical protein